MKGWHLYSSLFSAASVSAPIWHVTRGMAPADLQGLMETRFAGSQRLDARRRRRLAADPEGPLSPDTSCAPESDGEPGGKSPSRTTPEIPPWIRNGPIPLVPQKLWKHLAGFALFLTAGAGLLWAGWQLGALTAPFEQRLRGLLDLTTGSAPRTFGGGALLLAGELSLLIWWYRAHSLQDFSGRYRIWGWISAGWFLAALCALTGGHGIAAELCLRLSPTPLESLTTVAWLIPTLLLGVGLWFPLYRELQGCRGATVALLSASALYLVAASLELHWLQFATPQHTAAAIAATFWLAQGLALLSLSLFARHVLYFNDDPLPVKIGNRRIDRWHSFWPRPTTWFRKAAVEDAPPPATEQGGESRKTPVKSRRKSVSPPAPASAREPDPGVQGAEEPEPQAPAAPVQLSELPRMAAPREASVNPPSVPHRGERPDVPPPEPQQTVRATHASPSADSEEEGERQGEDDPTLRGMSKKQRRRALRERQEREQAFRR